MSEPANTQRRSTLPVLLSVAVSAAIIGFLLSRVQWDETTRLLAGMDRFWLMMAFLATCLVPFFAGLRFWGIVRVSEQTRLPFKTVLSLVTAANVLNAFLPSKGGDVVKALYYKKRGLMSGMLGTVLIERVIDVGMLGLLGALSALFLNIPWALFAGSLLFLVAFGLIAILVVAAKRPLPDFIPARITRMISMNASHFRMWSKQTSSVLLTLLGSAGNWLLAGLIVGFLVAGIHGQPEWLYVFAILPIAILSGLAPLTVSGIGTRDAAFVSLLEKVLTTEESTLVALGYTVFVYWVLALVSLPLATRLLTFYFKTWRAERQG